MDTVRRDQTHHDHSRLAQGDVIGPYQHETIRGDQIEIPDPDQRMHLQFRRFAGCPVCHLHLRSVAQRHDEIEDAGITEVVVFHSSREKMLEYEGSLPFDAIADPGKRLYRDFRVERMTAKVILAGLPNFARARVMEETVQGVLRGAQPPGRRGDG